MKTQRSITALGLSALLLASSPAALADQHGQHASHDHAGHTHHHGDTKAAAVMAKVQQATGSYADLVAKGDVEYTYTYRDNASGTSDISTERYLFNGELSWAKYTTHDKFVFPGESGTPVQGFDGENAWVTLDDQLVTDEAAVGMAMFMRKTNFYWFAMMQKLSDPGTIHAHKGTRNHDGVDYELIELTFDVPEGTAADTYLLYVNPETYLVDRFLFTVVDFGMVDNPLLMEVEHESFGDVMLPVTRRYTPSNWAGEVAADAVWVDEIMEDLKFNNGFTAEAFASPGK